MSLAVTTDPLNLVFSALADETRRAILARLAQGQTTVLELAAPFKLSLPAISKHLKVLERCGLVERGREAQWRPCRLKAEPMKQAMEWMEEYRQYWEGSFDRLDVYLKEVQNSDQKLKDKSTDKIEPKPQQKGETR